MNGRILTAAEIEDIERVATCDEANLIATVKAAWAERDHAQSAVAQMADQAEQDDYEATSELVRARAEIKRLTGEGQVLIREIERQVHRADAAEAKVAAQRAEIDLLTVGQSSARSLHSEYARRLEIAEVENVALRARMACLDALAVAVRARKEARQMPGFTAHDRDRRQEAVVKAMALEDAALAALDQAK